MTSFIIGIVFLPGPIFINPDSPFSYWEIMFGLASNLATLTTGAIFLVD